jgi:DNA-directed RNA polymerase subunit beta
LAVSHATEADVATNTTNELTTNNSTKPDSTGAVGTVPGAPRRVSFAKIREPLAVPNLRDLQTQSFEWLTGDENWFRRRVDAGDENPVGGLE